MSELFAFDSAMFGTDEAFARYCELYARGANVERTSAPFHARVRGWKLDRVILFAREYGGIRHVRGKRVEEDGLDHFTLNHVVAGELIIELDGHAVSLGPGESMLIDTTEPARTGADNVVLITVSVARDAVRAAVGDVQGLHGYRIGVHEGGLLSAMLRALVEQVPHLPVGAHAAITRTLIDLLTVAIKPFGAGARSEFHRLEHVRYENVRRVVEANIGVPDFSIQDIINATGISRASLYRLFDACGGVARFIQICRLQQLRDRLDNRIYDRLSLAELAPMVGFSDESHASRLFKQAFGITPGAYRAASIAGTQHPTVDLMARRWNSSLTELQ